MQFRVGSDFHLDTHLHTSLIFKKFNEDQDSCAMLAGDVSHLHIRNGWSIFEKFIKDVSKRFEKVFYVLGNHEFYGGDYFKTIEQMKDFLKDYPNVYFLNNEFHQHEDVKIYGCTLWTDYNNNHPEAKKAAYYLNDYNFITVEGERITPDFLYDIHKKEKAALQLFLETYPEDKKIIMTHHCPSFKLLDPQFKGDELNHCFASNLDKMPKPNVLHWISGHTHNATIKKKIGKVYFTVNPYGYNHEIFNNGYRENLILEI